MSRWSSLHYLTNDDPAKADRVEQLLNQAEAGEVKLVTAEMVMAETVWVLESSYGLGKAQVAPLVRGILATPGLEVINRGLVARALDHYETLNIDFVDGYVAVDSPATADAFTEQLYEKCPLFTETPTLGRVRPKLGVGLLSFPASPTSSALAVTMTAWKLLGC